MYTKNHNCSCEKWHEVYISGSASHYEYSIHLHSHSIILEFQTTLTTILFPQSDITLNSCHPQAVVS